MPHKAALVLPVLSIPWRPRCVLSPPPSSPTPAPNSLLHSFYGSKTKAAKIMKLCSCQSWTSVSGKAHFQHSNLSITVRNIMQMYRFFPTAPESAGECIEKSHPSASPRYCRVGRTERGVLSPRGRHTKYGYVDFSCNFDHPSCRELL